jgi:hypothetical protein
MKTRTEKLRETSGTVTYTDALTSFLYELMRDHLATGVVERIFINSVNAGPTTYTNGWLARYANNLAEELRNVQTNKLAEVLETAFEGPNTESSPSEKRPSFKIQEIKKLKESVEEVAEEQEPVQDDYGLSLVEQLEQSGQIPKEEADRLKKEIQDLKGFGLDSTSLVSIGCSDGTVEEITVTTNESSFINYKKEE